MTGFFDKLLIIIVCLTSQSRVLQGKFNLYDRDGGWMMNPYDYNCLDGTSNAALLMPISLNAFCFRPDTSYLMIADRQQPCLDQSLSFRQLKSMNVVVSDLFTWNAHIKTIESYSKYLVAEQQHLANTSYCKCSSPLQFGEKCQYEFAPLPFDPEELTFTIFLDHGITQRNLRVVEEMNMQHVTCFVGILCRNGLLCLDWRQICNGIVDCDRGDDEVVELCSQLELNGCDPEREFRCQNGMCIPISLRSDGEPDCLDRSDECFFRDGQPEEFLNYFIGEQFTYDEASCLGRQYSCGNGQCISYTNAVLSFATEMDLCQNRRNLVQLRQLFALKSNLTDVCWTLMMCLTGFSDLHSDVVCPDQDRASDIEAHCPDRFFSPANPVVYSFVYFLYEKPHRMWVSTYTGPDYICYDKSFCPNHTLISSTVSKANSTCFRMNATSFSWANIYEYVPHLFRSCFSTFSNAPPMNSQKLFRCERSNTFVTHHRVRNMIKDCYFGEDEDPTIDFCSIDSKDKFHCFTNRSTCIRQRFVADRIMDCADGSDEHLTNTDEICSGKTCTSRYQGSELFHVFPFTSLCDHVVDCHFISNRGEETDETDCEFWSYKCHNSPYTICNKIWNCHNGVDELNCSPMLANTQIERTFKCSKAEHYCIQFIKNRTDVNTTCLNANRTSDGVIDCIGATDERFSGVCATIYPFDYRRRFHCMNSSVCITAEQVCDRVIDCPFEDDELVCPWLYQSNATAFHCKDSPFKPIIRCDALISNPNGCPLKENAWFCDLSPKSKPRLMFLQNKFDFYPPIGQTKQSALLEEVDTGPQTSSQQRISSSVSLSVVNTTIDFWSCNHGHPVRSAITKRKFLCLCPMAYYGDYCQYQAERVTVALKIQHLYYFHPTKVFRLIVYLLDEKHEILSYEQIVFNHKNEGSRYFVYLSSRRRINASLHERSRSRFVRIDSYIVEETHVQYISSWWYDVAFPFLPVNRLSVVVDLEDESFLRLVRCKKNCGRRGKCMYYVNDPHNEYCRCDDGWAGERCHRKLPAHLCQATACAPHSRCVVLNEERKLTQCICPLGRSGDQCYISHNSCSGDVCLNNGTCLPLEQRSSRYLCICSGPYVGPQCKDQSPTLNVFIGTEISSSDRIPAVNVILAKSQASELRQKRELFLTTDLPTVLKAYGTLELGLIQIFYNFSTSAYYVIAILDRRPLVVNTSVIEDNRCQNVSSIFNQTILNDYSYIKRLKLYHLPCIWNRKLRCFIDEYRMCFCNRDRRSHCYVFDQSIGHCDYCQHGGRCIQEDELENQWQYICICAPCSFGSLCQFSTNNYYINLDILVGKDIRPGIHSFGEQPTVIVVVLISLVVILVFSLVSNLISFLILSDKKLQQAGCDLYLLIAVVISELGIVALFLRYLYMIIIQMYVVENFVFMKIACLLLEYLIRVIPSSFDWLVACISIERTYMIIKDVRFTKTIAVRVQKLARWIVLLVIALNILSTLHRPFFLTLVGEPILRGGLLRHPWCILRFNSTSWNIYERFINIFHLIVPFVLNLISIFYFIFHRAKLELASSVRNQKRNFTFVIRQQISKYKTILISTLLVIVVEIPRLILTFTYGCGQEKWHQTAYLVGYLASYLPLTAIFFIYILPSPKYRNRFRKILRENRLTRGLIEQ